jgi:hypothetical protein
MCKIFSRSKTANNSPPPHFLKKEDGVDNVYSSIMTLNKWKTQHVTCKCNYKKRVQLNSEVMANSEWKT